MRRYHSSSKSAVPSTGKAIAIAVASDPSLPSSLTCPGTTLVHSLNLAGRVKCILCVADSATLFCGCTTSSAFPAGGLRNNLLWHPTHFDPKWMQERCSLFSLDVLLSLPGVFHPHKCQCISRAKWREAIVGKILTRQWKMRYAALRMVKSS